MRKRKMNRALVVALSVAMASSNIAPTVTYAAESSQIFEASEQENPQEETSEQESKTEVETVSEDLQQAEQTVAEDKTITEETYLEYTPEEGNYTLSYQIRVNNGKKEAIIKIIFSKREYQEKPDLQGLQKLWNVVRWVGNYIVCNTYAAGMQQIYQ